MDEYHVSHEHLITLYEYPINEAASKLNICATKLKKICRSYGISRWPHRKYRSINNLINHYKLLIKSGNYSESEINEFNCSIERLQKVKLKLNKNCNTELSYFLQKRERSLISSRVYSIQHDVKTNISKPDSFETLARVCSIQHDVKTNISKPDSFETLARVCSDLFYLES